MTPKEKAEELINKFLKLTSKHKQLETAGLGAITIAKECALIVVDEILNNNCGSTTDYGVNAEDNELYIDEYYWFEVKQEIEKL